MNQPMESAPMKNSELGRYVCVASGGCLHGSRDINSDGVWVKTGGLFSSAHRDCYEATHPPPRCAYCGVRGPASLFESFNSIPGNLACRATAACELRQQGKDPAYELGVLLRAVRKELGALTGDQLVNLATDLTGYHDAVLRLLTAQGKARRTGGEESP